LQGNYINGNRRNFSRHTSNSGHPRNGRVAINLRVFGKIRQEILKSDSATKYLHMLSTEQCLASSKILTPHPKELNVSWLLHSTSSVPWILLIFSFELEQGFRESFRFCENICGTLKVLRGRNKSSHCREPFGFSSKLMHFHDVRYPREYKTKHFRFNLTYYSTFCTQYVYNCIQLINCRYCHGPCLLQYLQISALPLSA
jgi:hypothetical protein